MKVECLSKIYTSKKNVIKALDNVSFELSNKGLVILTGKSGSGKSTLLHIIGKIENPTEGKITYHDEMNKTSIGYIFQDFNLINDLSVIDNIKLGYGNFYVEINDKRIEEILEKLKIKELKNKKVKFLSQGEKQRVAISRALYRDAKIILADEPTGSVDRTNANNIFQILKELSKEILVVVTSHDIKLSERYADKIIKLDKGKIVDQITFNEVDENRYEINKTLKKKSKKLFNKLAFIHFFRRNLFQNIFLFIMMSAFFSVSLLMISIISFDEMSKPLSVMYQDKKHQSIFSYNDELNNKISLSKSDTLKDTLLKNMNLSYPIHKDMAVINYDSSSNYHYLNMVGIDEQDLDILNYKIKSGRFPKEIGEIAITSFHYEMMKRFGINNDGEILQINNEADVVNLTIKKPHTNYYGDFLITGIIDTGYDINYFNQLIEGDYLNNEINYIVNETAHYLLYTNVEFAGFYVSVNTPILTNEHNEFGMKLNISADANSLINEGQIILSHQAAIAFNYTNKSLQQYKNDHLNDYIESYAKDFYPQIKEDFESDFASGKWWLFLLDFGEEIDYNDYVTYIKERVMPSMTNHYDPSMGGNEITKIVDETFIKLIPIESTSEIKYINGDLEKTFEVKYLITSNEFNIVHYNDLKYFSDLEDKKSYERFLIAHSNEKEIKENLTKVENFSLDNEYFYQIKPFKLTLSNYTNDYPYLFEVLLGVCIVLLVLIGISFVSSRLKLRHKEKGLLKTLGYQEKLIYMNFLLEPVANILLSIVISVLITLYLVSKMNVAIQNETPLYNQMLSINLLNILLIVLISFITVVISIWISIKVDKKKTLSSIIREF